MPDSVVVDTNWIVDNCLSRPGRGSERLLAEAAGGRVIVYVPAFALAESVKAIEAGLRQRQASMRALGAELSEVKRSELLREYGAPLAHAQAALAQANGRVAAVAWQTLRRISELTVVPFDVDVVRHMLEFAFLSLDPGDLAILASVVRVWLTTGCQHFISADKDLQTDEIAQFLRDRGVAVWPSAGAFLTRRSRTSP